MGLLGQPILCKSWREGFCLLKARAACVSFVFEFSSAQHQEDLKVSCLQAFPNSV